MEGEIQIMKNNVKENHPNEWVNTTQIYYNDKYKHIRKSPKTIKGTCFKRLFQVENPRR